MIPVSGTFINLYIILFTSTHLKMTLDAEYYIKNLNLQKHPEGGFYRETYRSGEKISTSDNSALFPGNRNYSTAIYFLLKGQQHSKFHRILSDEIWHFHTGSAATIHIIHPDSLYEAKYLGPDLQKGQEFQQVVPAQSWFGVTVDDQNSFLLASCTVSPGFDFRDFEMADPYQLKKAFPEHTDIISQLS